MTIILPIAKGRADWPAPLLGFGPSPRSGLRQWGLGCGRFKLRNGFPLLRALTLVVMSALLANAQCYGACTTAECHPAQPPSSGSCHQHKTPSAPSTCQHQHTSISGPESGPDLAKAGAASHPLLAALVVMPAIATELSASTISPFAGSPPRPGISGRISILRI